MTTVRRLEPRDRRQLRDLASRNYMEQFQQAQPIDPGDAALTAYVTHIVQLQDSGKGVVMVAEREDRLIGFVCLLAPDKAATADDGEDSCAFMSDLYVVPECRQAGVGSLLTRALETQARSTGAGRIVLRVAADNAVARGFYAKEGYEENFVVMSKKLSGR